MKKMEARKEINTIAYEDYFVDRELINYEKPSISIVAPEEFVLPAALAVGVAGAVGAVLGAKLANQIM